MKKIFVNSCYECLYIDKYLGNTVFFCTHPDIYNMQIDVDVDEISDDCPLEDVEERVINPHVVLGMKAKTAPPAWHKEKGVERDDELTINPDARSGPSPSTNLHIRGISEVKND